MGEVSLILRSWLVMVVKPLLLIGPKPPKAQPRPPPQVPPLSSMRLKRGSTQNRPHQPPMLQSTVSLQVANLRAPLLLVLEAPPKKSTTLVATTITTTTQHRQRSARQLR